MTGSRINRRPRSGGAVGSDPVEKLRAIRQAADSTDMTRRNFSAYIANRAAVGVWSDADIAEYREEVGRIMAGGSNDEKNAAREFWELKAAEIIAEASGINARIRAAIANRERNAA